MIRCTARVRWPASFRSTSRSHLAEELLFGKLVKGGSVKVNLVEGKLSFDVTEATPPAVAPKSESDGDEGGTEREPESVE